jgi:hypothetical protein
MGLEKRKASVMESKGSVHDAPGNSHPTFSTLEEKAPLVNLIARYLRGAMSSPIPVDFSFLAVQLGGSAVRWDFSFAFGLL